MELSTLERVLFLILLAGAVAIAITKVSKTLNRVRRGKDPGPMDKFWPRLRKTLLYVPLQGSNLRSVSLRDPSGLIHFILFWGALILGLYFFVFLLLGDGLGLSGFFRESAAFAWLLQASGWVALALIPAMLFAVIRRLIKRPERLGPEFDGAVFTVLTTGVFLLMAGMLASEGLRAFLHESGYHAPLAGSLSSWFGRIGTEPSFARTLWSVAWWVQAGIIVGLIVYAPFSEHRHPFYGPFNIFFQLARHPRGMEAVDLTSAKRLGAAKPEHLTWKQLLEALSCAQCGRCQDACPAHATGKPLSPKAILMDAKRKLERPDSAFAPDALFSTVLSCTTCGACFAVCPMTNRPLELISELRRGLVYEGIYEAGQRSALKRVSRDSNPFGRRWNQRGESLHLKQARENEHYDCIYWIGCLAGFDDTAGRIAESTASILRAADVNFAVLGVREACCGDFVRRLGDEGLFQKLAETNIETLKGYNFDFILTHCPHCFNVLSNEYGQFGGTFEVVHHARFIEQLMGQGRISTGAGKEKIAFHDPCYLGRFNDIYESPRKVLSSIAGTVMEFPSNHAQSLCCGAGGGHVWMEEEPGEKMSVRRLRELSEDTPDVVATACPFCLMMLQEASRILDDQPKYRIADLAELIENNMQALT
jgi:Fe-S oxidoreductase